MASMAASSGAPPVSTAEHRRVRLRATDAQIALHAGPLAVSWAILVGVFGRAGAAIPQLVVIGTVGVASCAAALILLRWRGIELTPDQVVVRGDLARRVPWSDVQAVRTRRRGPTTTLVIETDRGRLRCAAPFSGLIARDPYIEEKIAFVQRWWLAAAPADVRARAWAAGELGWGQPVQGAAPRPGPVSP